MNPHTGHHPNWSRLTIALANWSPLHWDACKAIVCHCVLCQRAADDGSFAAVHVASVVRVASGAAAPADKRRTFHCHFHWTAGHALNDSPFSVIVKWQARDSVWVLTMILWSRWTGTWGCSRCHWWLLS